MDRLKEWAPADWPVAAGWRDVVDEFMASTRGRQLGRFVQDRLAAGAVIYPPHPFRALELTPLEDVRGVILGQDPYHRRGQAEGLAFSVPGSMKLPPSLRNIYKELGAQAGHGSLENWARQGVLLLNSSLTVEEGLAGSHARKGWEAFTDALLDKVARSASPCVYLLWGAHAQAKAGLIRTAAQETGREALILEANHPSPLSANRPPTPFIGCGHFVVARQWLAERGFPGFF